MLVLKMNILAVMPRQPFTSQRQYMKQDRMEVKRPPLPPPPPPSYMSAAVKAPSPPLNSESCAPGHPTVYVSSRFLAIKSSIEKFNEKKQKKTVSFQLEENTSGYDDNNNDDNQADISCAEKDTEKCRVGEENCEKVGENFAKNSTHSFPLKDNGFDKENRVAELESSSVAVAAVAVASLSGFQLVLCSESEVWKQFSIGFSDGASKLLLVLNNEFFSTFFKKENFHFPTSSSAHYLIEKAGGEKSLPSSLLPSVSPGGEESFTTNTSTPLDNENRREVAATGKKEQHNNKRDIVKVSVDEEDEEDLSSSPGSLDNAFKASNRLQRLEEHFKGFVHCSNRKFKPSLDSLSSCSSEFDTRYPAYDELLFNFECYDELLDYPDQSYLVQSGYSDNGDSDISDNSDNSESEGECNCDCDICKTSKMRELNGQLRGLLKKPNQTKARKNRVVFDETRNEFFEADYIILIREDCAYDEEDEEPCTCGEHELVRLCCEEGCQCNYTNNESANNGGAGSNDARAGQVCFSYFIGW